MQEGINQGGNMEDIPKASDYLKYIQETLTGNIIAANGVYRRHPAAVGKVQLQKRVES